MSDDYESPPRHTLSIPSFLVDEPIGLGEVIKRVTTRIGVSPCGGCNARAAKLDEWLHLEPRKRPDSYK
jgi:hypothetical protein